MKRKEHVRRLRPVPGWRSLPWWRKARLCCGQPTFAYSLVFALVGGGFLVAAPLLDPDLAVVGLILLAVAVFMFGPGTTGRSARMKEASPQTQDS